MAYRSVTHVAIRVTGLQEAERYYRTIFGMQVAFREAETADGWRTLPVGAEWEDAEAAGIPLSMCVLARNGFGLALEEDPMVDVHGVLDHVGLSGRSGGPRGDPSTGGGTPCHHRAREGGPSHRR